jgi:hypothetical protein
VIWLRWIVVLDKVKFILIYLCHWVALIAVFAFTFWPMAVAYFTDSMFWVWANLVWVGLIIVHLMIMGQTRSIVRQLT